MTAFAVWHVLVVVGWEGLATVEQHGYAQCHHHAPLAALLLSAVHPVALYTHTPSQAPSHCKQRAVCTLSACRLGSQPVGTVALLHSLSLKWLSQPLGA
jgi:hypothetical protein